MMCVFFFNDTATTEIYTLSLHDALPIFTGGLPRRRLRPLLPVHPRPLPGASPCHESSRRARPGIVPMTRAVRCQDRKSTRLNSSHANISYAVFCLKKKKNTELPVRPQLY